MLKIIEAGWWVHEGSSCFLLYFYICLKFFYNKESFKYLQKPFEVNGKMIRFNSLVKDQNFSCIKSARMWYNLRKAHSIKTISTTHFHTAWEASNIKSFKRECGVVEKNWFLSCLAWIWILSFRSFKSVRWWHCTDFVGARWGSGVEYEVLGKE